MVPLSQIAANQARVEVCVEGPESIIRYEGEGPTQRKSSPGIVQNEMVARTHETTNKADYMCKLTRLCKYATYRTV